MTVREELLKIRKRLEGIYDHREREAVILLVFDHVKQWGRVDLIIHEADELSDFAAKEIDSIVDRLILGEPIQYITGKARFFGMDISVAPGVLIPRLETEELVDWIEDDYRGKSDLDVLDIGTGSGCIAIALARCLTFPSVSALDFSEVALNQARANAEALKTRIRFLKADIYDWLPAPSSLDIIVSNPPYVAPDEKIDMEVRVLEYEPAEALFVEASDPIRPYKKLEEIARTGLRADGALYLELNPRFADDVKRYYESKGWNDVEIRIDSYGKKRMLRARK